MDSSATAITKNSGLYSTLQEKKDDDNNDLVPISSDSDMDLVGLGHDPKTEKKSHRRSSERKPNKMRKKRRKKSPSSLSLSLSPNSVDLTLSIKETIHRAEPVPIPKKENIHKCHHRSSEKKKSQIPQSRKHNRPLTPKKRVLTQKRPRTPLPRKSSSLLRQRRMSSNKIISNVVKSKIPLQQSSSSCGNVTKLLKKVRRLEPFSSRTKEKGSSLKDKLSNIIKTKENTASITTNEEVQNNKKSTDEIVIDEESNTQLEVKESKKENEEAPKNIEKQILAQTNLVKKEDKSINEDDDDLIILRQLALETKHKKNTILKSDEVKSEPQEQPLLQQLPPPPPPPPQSSPPLPPTQPQPPPPLTSEPITISESKSQIVKLPNFCMDDNDEDLELRMIALRSAVLKKHHTRMQRGIKKQKHLSSSPLPRIESPFTSTFLEDFPLLAEICSPSSPLNQKDIYSTEDMELDSDVEQEKHIEVPNQLKSPYSPTDDVSGIRIPITGNSLIKKEHDFTLSTNTKVYMEPMETPISTSGTEIYTRNHLDNNIMDIVGQELRPYSPTDVTIYDPDLPGVRSNKIEVVPPLQPPPLPPLTMFQQPMISACSTNLLNPFIDASVQALSTQTNNFTTIHQAVNPLLLSTTASASLFAYPTTTPMTNLTVNAQAPVDQHSQQSTLEINPHLDDFGETDIDGSPLVEIEKDSQHHMPWPLMNKPLYIQVPTDVLNTNLNKIPSLLENDGVSSIIMQNTTPPSTICLQKSKQTFNDLKTIKTTNSNFQPFKQRTSPKKLITKKSAAIFNNEGQLDEQPQEIIQKGKRKLSIALLERTRKRKKSCTLKKNNSSILAKSKENKYFEIKDDLSEQDKKRRRTSVDDDEEALREILLASLAKRSKEQQIPIINKLEISDNSQVKPSDNNPKINEEKNSSLKQELNNEISQTNKTAVSIISQKLETTTLATNQIKKLSTVPLSPSENSIRKFIRKTSLPASTKVVNNAKRYQNLLNQRKLNQQKISMITSLKSRFKVNNNKVNHMNIRRQESPQLSKKIKDSERIIFCLQDDTESEPEVEDMSLKSKLNNVNRPKLNIPTSDFERSVDQFLKNVRLQQEMSTKDNSLSPKTVTPTEINKHIPIPVTPKKILSVTSMISPPTPSPKNVFSTVSNVIKDSLKTKNSISATAIINSAKDKIIASTSKGPRTDVKMSSLSMTPQALKHLPVSQQEEYRRLKQQIFERERLKLQKTKESIAASTCVLTQGNPEQVVNTSISALSSSSISSPSSSAIVSSTPKSGSKSVAASYTVKSRELPSLNKTVPKTHLIATISPMSKQNSADLTKSSVAHYSAKINKLNPKSTQNSLSINKTVSLNTLAKKGNNTLSDVKAVTVSPKVSLLSSKQIASELNINQKTQVKNVTQKSSLRVLTKEQINNKTKQIQQIMTNSDSGIVMDDLNRHMHKIQPSQISVDILKTVNTKDNSKPNTLKNDCKNDFVNTLPSNYKQSSSIATVATKTYKSTQNWDEFKQGVNDEVESLSVLSTATQKNLLRETEEKLIKKRYLVLDDITEMSSNLRQWEMEKDIQNLLIVEIKSLREQLKIAEKKLHKQKDKLSTIQPKVSNYHEKINNGRKECFRLSKICNCLGQTILGANYKFPTAGAELLNNKIKEVASHTQQLRNKRSQPTETMQNTSKIKIDKIISKTNSKSQNIKLKKSNEMIISQNNETTKCTTESVDNNSIIHKIPEPDSKVSHNGKVNLNTINVHDKLENQSIQVSNDSSSINNKNINTTCNESLTNPENKFNLINDNSLNLKVTTNNFPSEIQNQCSEVNAPNEIIYTENVNSETIKSLSNVIVNTSLTSENNINLEQSTNNNKSNKNCVGNRVKTKNKNKFSDSKIMETDVILTDATKQENDNLMKWSDPNSILISQNISGCRNIFPKTIADNPILKSEKTELEHENCLINRTRQSRNLIQPNNNFNSEILLVDVNNENTMSTDKFIQNEFEKQLLPTNINYQNFNSESSVFTNKNLPLNLSNVNTLAITKNINFDSETLMNTNSNNESVNLTQKSTETIEAVNLPLITENYECNCETNNLNEFVDKLVIVNQTKKSDMENDKNSTSKIINSEHSTLSEERELLKLADDNKVSVSESIQYSKSTISNESTSDLIQSMVNNDVSLSKHEDSTMKKKVFQPYESILKHLNIPRSSQPDGILCPFEIMGTCNDGDCQFIHQTTSHCR